MHQSHLLALQIMCILNNLEIMTNLFQFHRKAFDKIQTHLIILAHKYLIHQNNPHKKLLNHVQY